MRKTFAGVMIALFLLLAFSPWAEAVVRKGPYLMYRGNPAQMTVLWQLDSYQTCTIHWGLTTEYSSGSADVAPNGDMQYQYTISGLLPGTLYYYQVEGVGSGSFRAAPGESAASVKLLAYSDPQGEAQGHDGTCAVMIDRFTSDPSFQTLNICGGDWSDEDDETVWAAQYFTRAYEHVPYFLAHLPVAGPRGNHEGVGTVFKKYWPYPYVSDFYWSFDYGPVHVTVLDQYVSYAPGSAQYNWLVNDLSTTSKPWKILTFHQPGWSGAGNAGNDVEVQQYIQPLCVQYGVDLVISGHHHQYARAVVQGVQHLTIGGANYTSTPIGGDYIVAMEGSSHYLEIDIQGQEASVTARRRDGSAIETFTLSHGPSVRIMSPQENSILSAGQATNVQARVLPLEGICTEVRFYADGQLIGTDLSESEIINYYGVDRALTSEFAMLAQNYHVNTIVVALDVNDSSAWKSTFDEAAKFNINLVVWPSDWTRPRGSGCGWEAPYINVNGDYITHVKNLLSAIGNYSNFIGIVNAHEPFSSCTMSIAEMESIKDQLKDYVRNNTSNHREIKVWNYVDNIDKYMGSYIPSNADISRIMDVAVTWQHCFGGAEGTCENALGDIVNDRNRINSAGLNGVVELVFLPQSFAIAGTDYRMPTASEMLDWGCRFLDSNALDGFIWYTWGAKWYTEDLDDRSDLWPTMNQVHDSCVISSGPYTVSWVPPLSSSPVSLTAEADIRYSGSTQTIRSVPVTVNVMAGPQPQSFNIPLSASTDDAEEFISIGWMYLNSSDLELIHDSEDQIVGMRFNNIPVPAGATILEGHIQFTVKDVSTGPCTLVIRGQAADHAATFSSAYYDISRRPLTSAAVSWIPASWPTVGVASQDQRTPDLSAILQEIMNRPGWRAGNSLALIVSGSGTRTAVAYDLSPSQGPKLAVTYLVPPAANQAPVVNAGPDRTITLANSATLSGTATDDGLPNPPATLTIAWSQVSGPGTVAFGNASSLSTTASFSAAGSYTLRLTASDSALSSSDDIVITVNPANTAPVVNAGPDQTLTLPNSATLSGTATDDGLPNPPARLTIAWSQVSGPDTVTFGNLSSLSTTASFSAAGSYTLRLTASDSALSSSDDIAVTVNSQNAAPVSNAGPDQTITLPSSATLHGTVTDDGLPNPPGAVTTTWSKVTGLGTVTFGNPNVLDTTASFSQSGNYVLRLTTNDGALSSSDDISITVQDSGVQVSTLEVRVAAGNDDAEENASGAMYRNSTDLELIYDGSNQTVGMRFAGVSIPPGATIVNAYLQFWVDETSSDPTFLTVQGQAIDNALGFSTATRNISSRSRTAASVSWVPPAWLTVGAAGLDQRTSNLSSVIQEIVSRPGWVRGNSLAIIVTGTGHRVAVAYEGNPARAPLLHVEYSTGAPPANVAPSIYAGPDQTITLPSSATLHGTVTDDGLPNPPGTVTTTWSTVSGPGTVTFGNPNALNTTASFSAAGTYVLRLTANDTALSSSDDISVTVLSGGTQVTTLEVKVAAGNDDAEENASGSMYLNSTDLELIYDGSNQTVGMRFAGVSIPQGATIVNAYLQFWVDEETEEPTFLTVQGQAIDNAPGFSTTKWNISSRSRTAAGVSWVPPAWLTSGEAGLDQRTPNLSSVIQEIVSRPGWVRGNSLAIIITGTGHRVAVAYEGNPAGAPLLHVEYF